MAAFALLETRWPLFGGTGEVFVVAIGSSCCGDTLEADLEKKVGFGKGKGSHLDCLLHQ
jgi:hypothetical protein